MDECSVWSVCTGERGADPEVDVLCRPRELGLSSRRWESDCYCSAADSVFSQRDAAWVRPYRALVARRAHACLADSPVPFLWVWMQCE